MRKAVLLLVFSFIANTKTGFVTRACHKERKAITGTTLLIQTLINNKESDADDAIIIGFWYNNVKL